MPQAASTVVEHFPSTLSSKVTDLSYVRANTAQNLQGHVFISSSEVLSKVAALCLKLLSTVGEHFPSTLSFKVAHLPYVRKKPTPKLIRKPLHQSSKVLLKVAALCLEPPWPLTASSLLLRSQRANPIGVVLFSADSPLLSIPACNPNQGSPPQPLTTYVGCLLLVRKKK